MLPAEEEGHRAEVARTLNPGIRVVLRTHSEDESRLLQAEGVGDVFFWKETLARGMASHVLKQMARPAGD